MLLRFFTSIILFFVTTQIQGQIDRPLEDVKGLEVGAKAPDFTAIDQNGETFVLSEKIKTNTVVLIFYRGQWCPVCNRHLSNLQDSLNLILEKSAIVIAVSPERTELQHEMIEKTGVKFTLLYDEGYKISDGFDVTYTPSAAQRISYNTILGADLKDAHSNESENLPVPATFIIDKNQTIKWRQFNQDHHNRSTVKQILENL